MRFIRLLFLLLITIAAAAQTPAPAPHYEVYAVRYATLSGFPKSALLAGADRAQKVDIAMVVWLVRGGGHTILVDSGFYRDHILAQWKPQNFVKPSEALAPLGVKPEDVTDIVLTHMHWDHADGLDLFPNARVWIQKDEYTYYTGEAWQSRRTHGGIEPDDVLAIVKMNMAGKVSFVNGDAQEILPGISCYTGGKHTYASQFVTVSTGEEGTVVLASDNMYLYENLEKHAPIAQTLDPASNLAAQDRMKQLAAKPELIVPGHDPEIFNRYPKPGNGIAKIAD